MDQRRGIDYKRTCFENLEVTKIIGELTLGPLLGLETEVKANAVSAHTSLGGGSHGHLGLATKPEIYNKIQTQNPTSTLKTQESLKLKEVQPLILLIKKLKMKKPCICFAKS